MYPDIFSNNLVIREWLNGSLFPLTVNLTLVIGVYIVQCFAEARRNGSRFRDTPGIQTACVLLWVFGAESARASFVWFSLRAANDAQVLSDSFVQVSNWILAAGAVVLVTAVLRCTYLFTPPRFRNAFWVYSLCSTIIFLLLSHFYPVYPAFAIAE